MKKEFSSTFGKIFKTIMSGNGSELAELPLCINNVNTEVYYILPYRKSVL